MKSDLAICPVCGLEVYTQGMLTARRNFLGKKYFFCSEDCAVAFDEFPEEYIEE